MTTPDSSQVHVQVFLSPKDAVVTIPESFTVTADLTYPRGVYPDKEAMLDHLLRRANVEATAPFVLLREWDEAISSDDPGRVHQKLNFELEPQLPGRYGLTFLNIPFLSEAPSSDDSPSELYAVLSPIVFADVTLPTIDSINMSVEAATLAGLSRREPIEADTATRAYLLRDHASFNKELFQNRGVLWEAAGVLALFLLMTWLVNVLLKNKKCVVVALPEPENPLSRSEELLDQLKLQPLLQPKIVEAFIVELTNCVRDYFAKHFHVEAAWKTTQETAAEFQKHPEMLLRKKEAALAFLQTTDRIKFAGYQPSLEECIKVYHAAEELLDENH